jgi:F-type H+-transporting ATPase subunit b
VQFELLGSQVLLAQEEEEPAAEEEHAEEQEAPNPILPATNEIIWGSLAFIILFVAMWKWAYPAIRKAMEDRTAKIQADLDAADGARQEAEELRAQYDAQLADARAEANRIIDEARQQAEAVRTERIAAIDQEIADRRAQAEADIAGARARAEAELRTQVATLAIGAAEAVVEQNLNDETNRQLVENFIDRVGAGT